jgi:hypothetical protein
MVELQSSKLVTGVQFPSPALSLGKQQPYGAAPERGAPPVAVGAHDLALFYLSQDGVPVAFSKAVGDSEGLIFDVVELQHDDVVFTAIGAGMITKVIHEEVHSLLNNSPAASRCIIYVPLAMFLIVVLLIGSAARPAIIVSLALVLSPPGKLIQRLLAVASPASPEHDMANV